MWCLQCTVFFVVVVFYITFFPLNTQVGEKSFNLENNRGLNNEDFIILSP
jgi:hypothetical protein